MITPAQLEYYLRHYWPATLPMNQDRSEVRWGSAVLTMFFIAHLIEPTLYAASVDSSIMFKVAQLTGWPNVVMGVFVVAAALMVPHLFALFFMPDKLANKVPRKLAIAGACMASFTWMYLANMARPLDVGPLSLIYLYRSIFDAAIALAYATSVNNQSVRKALHDARQSD
jgi:hypothetical protein